MDKKADAQTRQKGAKKFLPFVSGALIIVLIAFLYFVVMPLITTSMDVVILTILCLLLGILVILILHIRVLIPNLDKKGESLANFIAGIDCVILVVIIVVAYSALTDIVTASYILISTILAVFSVSLFFRSGIVER